MINAGLLSNFFSCIIHKNCFYKLVWKKIETATRLEQDQTKGQSQWSGKYLFKHVHVHARKHTFQKKKKKVSSAWNFLIAAISFVLTLGLDFTFFIK